MIADLSVKRHCADGSVIDVKISSCKLRTLLNFSLCLGTEKPISDITALCPLVYVSRNKNSFRSIKDNLLG